MTEKLDNPPAFPVAVTSPTGNVIQLDGMSLRDYFAAAALPALIQARVSLPEDEQESFIHDINLGGWGAEMQKNPSMTYAESLADDAYCLADAMLKARTK